MIRIQLDNDYSVLVTNEEHDRLSRLAAAQKMTLRTYLTKLVFENREFVEALEQTFPRLN